MNILKKRMLSRPSGFLAMAVSAVLAATLQAAEVTADMALAAAGAWSAENRTLSGAMGSPVSVKERRSDKGALLWYEVAMSGGGGVAVAPDTGIEPIIAVFRDCNGEIPEGHPLCTMLERDMRERLTATKKDRNPLRKGAVAAGAVDDRMENIKMRAGAKWKRLASRQGLKQRLSFLIWKGYSCVTLVNPTV